MTHQLIQKEINGEMITQDSLVKLHRKMVHNVCKKYKFLAEKVGMEYDDIVSIGNIGLIKAFKNFDREKFDVRFSTYAIPVMLGEIQRALRDQNPGVKYSRPIKDIATLIQKAELQDSRIDAIATNLDVGRNKVIHALNYISHANPRSLDKRFTNESEQELSLHAVVGLEEDTTVIFVEDFINSLPARERVVVIELMEGLKQVEIGEKVGVSQVQVSRIIKKIRIKYIAFFREQDSDGRS